MKTEDNPKGITIKVKNGPVKKVWNAIKPFVNGGCSGMMATVVIQPIDMVKTRIQLGATGNPIQIGVKIVK